MGTYVCVLAIFLLASSTTSVSMLELPLRLLADDLAAVAEASCDARCGHACIWPARRRLVAFFPKEGAVGRAGAAAAPPTADAQRRFAAAWAKQPRVDLGIAADGAKVVVVKFNDYECPGLQGRRKIWLQARPREIRKNRIPAR